MPSITAGIITFTPVSKRGIFCSCTIGESMKRCKNPAAVRLDMGGKPIYQCARCFKLVRKKGDPTLEELRELIGWES